MERNVFFLGVLFIGGKMVLIGCFEECVKN